MALDLPEKDRSGNSAKLPEWIRVIKEIRNKPGKATVVQLVAAQPDVHVTNELYEAAELGYARGRNLSCDNAVK